MEEGTPFERAVYAVRRWLHGADVPADELDDEEALQLVLGKPVWVMYAFKWWEADTISGLNWDAEAVSLDLWRGPSRWPLSLVHPRRHRLPTDHPLDHLNYMRVNGDFISGSELIDLEAVAPGWPYDPRHVNCPCAPPGPTASPGSAGPRP